ncbi:MAG: hypothetical protein GY765_32530, partial [bacterium]|nr:hypothetical protein [bacterium]
MKTKKLETKLGLNKSTIANLESNEMKVLQAGIVITDNRITGCVFTYNCVLSQLCESVVICNPVRKVCADVRQGNLRLYPQVMK